ncbi:reverse transcriptase domain-containing protein [Tanacetum coccineum]
MNTASTSGSGSLPSNTVANPRGDLKAITTRSGISYDEPPIPPPSSSLPKVVEREPELREKDDNLASKFVEIFRELNFELSFVDALLQMPKFASMFKSLLNNKEKLFDLAKTPVNENCLAVILKKLPEKLGDPDKFLIPCDFPELVECIALSDLGASINLMPLSIWKKLSLPELTPTQMILELTDRSTTSPSSIAEDVFVKVGKFYFQDDFVVIDYVVDPRVPLILERPFFRTERALIDVYGEELTLRVDDDAITFKVGQTSRYSYNDVVSINRIDVIDVACEEYAQEVLGFLVVFFYGGNQLSSLDPILSTSSPSLTPFEEGRPSSTREVINDDPSSPLPPKELNLEELKDLPSHLEYAFLEGTDKLLVIFSKNIKEDEKTKRRPPSLALMGRLPTDACLSAYVMLRARSKGTILGQRKTKHFQPIHYASKTMTDAQAHYTTTEKELLAMVYAFEKFRSYLVLSKTIVYTDHSVLKYLLAKQDSKPRLLPWILLLQEFDVIIQDKKRAKNLAADHLSRLENPHQDVLENKETNKTFPLETLSMVTFRGDDSTPWFSDFANYPAGNFLAIISPLGNIMVPTTPPRKFLTQDSFSLPFTEMPTTWSHGMTLVNVKEKSRNVMKCLKMQFKYARSLTCGASTSWARSRLHEGTRIYSWPSITCQNGLKQKRSPPMTPELIVGENRASWSDKLDDALWAFCTAFKTPIGCTPYKLVYRKACHFPIELEHKAYWALKHYNFDLKTAEKTKKIHDSKIKNRVLNVGDQVLLFNYRLKIFSGKLKTRWTGPFTVAQVLPYGTVELSQADGQNFKVDQRINGSSLFMACNPKDCDGNGGAIVYTRWIEKMELVHDMSGCGENQKTRGREAAVGMTWEDFKTLTREELCPNNEMKKLETEFWCHVMVEAGHVVYTDRFHELARLVPHLVTPKNKRIERYIHGLALLIRVMVAATEPTTIQSVVLNAGMLTDEAIRNGALKKISEKRGNNRESSRDGNARDDNKRSRTGRAFATTTNPVRKEYTGNAPKCTNCNHQPELPYRLCTNCNRFGHLAKDYRVRPRVVNSPNARNLTAARGVCFECGGMDHYKAACPRLNRASKPGGNHPNQAMAVEGGQGRGNNGDQARGRAFMMGAGEARQDPNIVMGTFTLDNYNAITLFDSGADYSFVSTTFMPLLDIEPNNLGFSYEIKIASGQLVKINKVIQGCKLGIKGHIFDIDLIPFGHKSFDVIVGMDWLSRHKAEIVFHEKVVKIPLSNGEILKVLGESPAEKVRHSKSAKVKEQRLKDMVIVKNFSKVFPDDLSGLPPSREIEFRIDLIPGAMSVAKYPYRLAPPEMEELSSQLRELQDKGFI